MVRTIFMHAGQAHVTNEVGLFTGKLTCSTDRIFYPTDYENQTFQLGF